MVRVVEAAAEETGVSSDTGFELTTAVSGEEAAVEDDDGFGTWVTEDSPTLSEEFSEFWAEMREDEGASTAEEVV